MADERLKLTTPKGEVVGFAAISKPSTIHNTDGVFEATLAFDPEVVQDLISELEALRDQEFARLQKENPKIKKQLKKVPVFKEEVDDDGEETGRVTLKVKQNAMIRPKGKEPFKKIVRIFDAKGKPVLKKKLNIGSGSIGKASFEPSVYLSQKDKEVGVTLRFTAFQLIKYVEFVSTGPSASNYGFEAEEEDEDAFDADAFSADDEDTDSSDGDESQDDDQIDF